MKIFITGGTGVVGCRTVPRLLQQGHSVTVAIRSERSSAKVTAGAAAVVVNLFDQAAVMNAVRDHDVVISLATNIPSGPMAFVPFGWWTNNRLRRGAVRNLANAAVRAKVDRFLQESYAPMYAAGGDGWLTESSPVHPSPHVRSAVDAENTALALTNQGITPVVLRFALFYGPDSVHTKDMVRFVKKGIAPMFGDPSGYLSSIHTDDAAAALIAALTAPAGVYNVTDDEPVPKRAYFSSLARALGVAEPRFFPHWTWRLAGSVGDNLKRSHRIANGKLKATTVWKPAYPTVSTAWPSVLKAMRR